MEYLTVKNFQYMIETMTDIIIENEVPFCELDAVAGDGDFGMSLAKGFKMLKQEWKNVSRQDIGAMLKDCSLIILENCGGASGPIWGSAFAGAARATKNKQQVNLCEFAAMFNSSAEAIMKRGGAKKGDKTLLDALIPAVESLEKSASEECELFNAMQVAAQAAVTGAESTKTMIASRGRASYVGERSLTHPDAGAYAVGVIFTEVVSKMKKEGINQ